jgi:hypothetical protein
MKIGLVSVSYITGTPIKYNHFRYEATFHKNIRTCHIVRIIDVWAWNRGLLSSSERQDGCLVRDEK